MSDTQFSSLSPNSSYDLEPGKYYSEECDHYDQETISITSDKSYANGNTDPFLLDFVKEEPDDVAKPFMFANNFTDTSDMSIFYGSLNPEHDSDESIFAFTDDMYVHPNLLDLESMSPANPLFLQRQLSNTFTNKRAFSPMENIELSEMPLSTKHRRVEVSSHLRCDEWINKYHETSEHFSFKASGVLDRRKTKHHKVLSEYDSELQIQNIDSKRSRGSLFVKKSILSSSRAPIKMLSKKTNAPLSLSSTFAKFPTIRSVSQVIRKAFNPFGSNIHENYKLNTKDNNSHITAISVPDSPSLRMSPSVCSQSLSDIVEMPRIPAPLRMGKRVSRRGLRFALWQFLLCLLDSSKYREQSTGIKWLNRTNGVFHIVDSKQVATLWGQYKERRDKMTYDSLARSLRHYYKKNLMAKINNRRLVYQIAQECLHWSSETFLRRTKDGH